MAREPPQPWLCITIGTGRRFVAPAGRKSVKQMSTGSVSPGSGTLATQRSRTVGAAAFALAVVAVVAAGATAVDGPARAPTVRAAEAAASVEVSVVARRVRRGMLLLSRSGTWCPVLLNE